MTPKLAIGHVGVQASIRNMADVYAKIISDNKSKQLYTGKLCLIGNEDPECGADYLYRPNCDAALSKPHFCCT